MQYLWPVCNRIIRVSVSNTLESVKWPPSPLHGDVLVQGVSAVSWSLLESDWTGFIVHAPQSFIFSYYIVILVRWKQEY